MDQTIKTWQKNMIYMIANLAYLNDKGDRISGFNIICSLTVFLTFHGVYRKCFPVTSSSNCDVPGSFFPHLYVSIRNSCLLCAVL